MRSDSATGAAAWNLDEGISSPEFRLRGTDDSVGKRHLQKSVIEKMTIENTGAFLSHHGDKNWL
jgi:hypothetical protein